MLNTHIGDAFNSTNSLGDSTALVNRCRRGDQRAWAELYEAHFEFAWRTARRLGAPEADLDDSVQDAFHIAWRQLAQFTHGRFTTWLFRIVANVVSERLRRKRVRDVFAGASAHAPTPQTPCSHDRIEARQLLEQLVPVLESLGQKKQEVFSKFEVEGFTHAEIAAQIGANEQTVRTRLHYARKDFEQRAKDLNLDMSP